MQTKVNEFIKELMSKGYDYIIDTQTGVIYFNPREILKDCGFENQSIKNKLSRIPGKGKKLFNKCDLQSAYFLKVREIQLNSQGEYWVTIFALIDLLDGRKKKATEIKQWLIYEVLPKIIDNGYFIEEEISKEQLFKMYEEAQSKVTKTYNLQAAAEIIGYPTGAAFKRDCIKYGLIHLNEQGEIVYAESKYFTHTKKQFKTKSLTVLELKDELNRMKRNTGLLKKIYGGY